MKKSSFIRQKTNRTIYIDQQTQMTSKISQHKGAHFVGIVEVQDPAARLVDIFMAFAGATHGQGRIHVHVMAGQVERNQALKDDGPAGESRCEEDEQARCCTSIGDHVKKSAEASRLVKVARGITVESIEET